MATGYPGRKSPWGAWPDMRRLQDEMNRLFESEPAERGSRGGLPVNIWVGKDDVVVAAELPGMDAKEIEITSLGNMLTISGNREETTLEKGVVLHRRERGHGKFMRTVELPVEVEENKVEATYKNGVLKITLEREEAARPRQIQVKTQ